MNARFVAVTLAALGAAALPLDLLADESAPQVVTEAVAPEAAPTETTPEAAPSEDPFAALDAEVASGDPQRIRNAIVAYEALDANDPEVMWRLLRAYFQYYDQLAERGRETDQAWAVDTGYEWVKKIEEAKSFSEHPKVVYHAALIGLAYLDVHQMKALFIAGDVMDRFRNARKLDPAIDDWGPDRSLGILYNALPGWPVSKGDMDKALEHMSVAAKNAPERAINRLMMAKILIKEERYDEAREHMAFLKKGKWKVSSPHWREITQRRIEETARDLPAD